VLLGSALSVPERRVVSVLGPRGLAAGVLATFPLAAGLPASSPIPVVVYSAVITTILAFAIGLPMVRPRPEPEATSEPASADVA
jgi:Na+:H+ antiporter